MMEYDILWNGSHKDTYLCVQDPSPTNMDHVRALTFRDPVKLKVHHPYRDRGAMRSLILSTLKARGQMTIKALRAIVEPNDAQFYNLVSRMTEQGMLIRGQRGLVALKRRNEA